MLSRRHRTVLRSVGILCNLQLIECRRAVLRSVAILCNLQSVQLILCHRLHTYTARPGHCIALRRDNAAPGPMLPPRPPSRCLS